MTPIRFDDIDALRAAISEEFGPWSDAVEVTQEMIDRFADLTGDHQWLHVEVERARAESPFGGPIAHGFLTLSLISALVGGTAEITGQKSGTNYGAESLRFLSPVPAGSVVHARTRIMRVEERATGGTLITREVDVRVVDAEKPAVLYRMQVLYR